MRVAMGWGVVVVACMATTAYAAKADKPAKVRAAASLGEDGPSIDEFVTWRAVPILDEPGDATPIDLGPGRLDGELPPGKYVIEAEVAPVVQGKEVDLGPGKRARLDFEFEGSFVEFAPKNVEGTYSCSSTDGRSDREFTADGPTRRFFTPGVWEVSCERGVMSVGKILEIGSGQTFRLGPDLSTGTLTAKVANDEAYPDELYFEIREVNPRTDKARSAVHVVTGEMMTAKLPPGSYEVLGRMAIERPVADFVAPNGTARASVEVGDATEVEIAIPWALVKPVLTIDRRAKQPEEPRWYIFPAEDRAERPYGIRLEPVDKPFTIHAYDQAIVVEVRDAYDVVVGTSEPFLPVEHAVTEVPIRIRK